MGGVVAIVGADARARYGAWDEPVVLAPETALDASPDEAALVVIVPSCANPRWEPVFDRFTEIVVQDESAFARWIAAEARERGVPVRSVPLSRSAPA